MVSPHDQADIDPALLLPGHSNTFVSDGTPSILMIHFLVVGFRKLSLIGSKVFARLPIIVFALVIQSFHLEAISVDPKGSSTHRHQILCIS